MLTSDSAIFAGSRGFNLASGLFLPARERVRDVIAVYRQTLREHGWKPEEKEIAGVFQMYCGESQEEARRNGGQYALRYFEFFNSLDRRSQHDRKVSGTIKAGCQGSSRTKVMRILRRSGC